jgi:hypothetical protein
MTADDRAPTEHEAVVEATKRYGSPDDDKSVAFLRHSESRYKSVSKGPRIIVN